MESFIDWLESQKYRNEELRKKNRRELGRAAGLIGLAPSPEHTLGNDDIAAAMYNYRYPRDARDARGADVMAQNYENEKNAALAESFDALKKQNAKNESLGRSSLKAERNESMGWLKGSEQHRAKLEKSIGDYDREIAKLQAEIAMSEAGDPMYDLAVMRMIMDNDMSLMNDIRGRIGKKIDQEFQMKQKKADQEFQHNENELNRENALEVAKMNKDELNASKLEDARADLKKKRNILFYRISQAENDPWNDDGGLVLAAWNDYNDAKKNLGKLGETEDDEMFLSMLKGNFPTTGNVEAYIQDVAPKRAEKQRLIAASTNPEIRSDQLMDIYKQLSESGLGSPKELQELGDKYANLKKKENKNAVVKARATEDKNVASWIKSNRAGTQAKIEAKVDEASKKWQHRKFSWKQVNGSTYEVVEVK